MEGSLPTIAVDFYVPELRASVHGLVREMIGKLDSEIVSKVNAAFITRANTIDDQVKREVESAWNEGLKFRISSLVIEELAKPEYDTQLKAFVKAEIEKTVQLF